MSVYNFGNLNDYEFEQLCKDIMEKKLGTALKMYSRGIDGGIDLDDLSGKNKIIVQVKHYFNSNFSTLKSNLKKELEKVQNLSPESYYLCLGKALTPGNVREIYTMFSDYMCDMSHIITLTEIDEFLSMDKNNDIVKKNYKLWLNSSNVLSLIHNQHIFIDCDELILNIEEEAKFFVDTTAFYDAAKILEKEKMLIVVGSPGVGKTTLSKMLVLRYAEKGYSVRYASDNSVSDIKQSLSIAEDTEEIILLDDFLGQHYLEMSGSQTNEIKSLVSKIKRYSNKRIILNSRITILNEAKQIHQDFDELLYRFGNSEYLVNMDKISLLEKAKIFYNHIYFNELPEEYLLAIKEGQKYLDIVKHRNFNPRIIEYATQKRNYINSPPSEYGAYLLEKLNNPSDIWVNEFENRIDTADRMFLVTIYSLTNGLVDEKVLEKVFNSRIKKVYSVDKTINQFERTLKRLNNSLIKIVVDNGIKKVGVANPSINDFLRQYLKENALERSEVLKSAVYVEQLERVGRLGETKYLIDSILSGHFLRMESLILSIEYHFIKNIETLRILDKGLVNDVKNSVLRCFEDSRHTNDISVSFILSRMFIDEFCSFYCLEEYTWKALGVMHFEGAIGVVCSFCDTLDYEYNYELQDLVAESKSLLIEKYVESKLEHYDEMAYKGVSDYFNVTSGIEYERCIKDISNIVLRMKQEFSQIILNDFEEDVCNKYSFLNADVSDLDLDGFIENINFEEIVQEYLYDGVFSEGFDVGIGKKESFVDEIKEVHRLFGKTVKI